MNLKAAITLRATGTSEGAVKGWDTRGRGRTAQPSEFKTNPTSGDFETGKPVKVIGYHASDKPDQLKMGTRGIFFAPEPAPDYGDQIHRAEITLKNPAVFTDNERAAKAWLSPPDYRNFAKLTEDMYMGNLSGDDYWRYADRMLTNEAKKRGYDGIIYTQPESLSRMEFNVFDKGSFNAHHVGSVFDWGAMYPDEAKRAGMEWAMRGGEREHNKNSMSMDAGGPGSGRKPEMEWNPYLKDAYKPSEYKRMSDREIAHYRFGNHRQPYVHPLSDRIDPRILMQDKVSGLDAGGPGSGRHKEGDDENKDVGTDVPYPWASPPRPDEDVKRMSGASQYGDTGWQYGRSIARSVGFIPTRSMSGFPTSGGGGGHSRGALGRTVHPHVSKPHVPKGPSVRMPNPSGHSGFNVRKPNLSIHRGRLESAGICKHNLPAGKCSSCKGKNIKADIGGEPMTGNMGHVHIDPVTWFKPPSLSKRHTNEELRIPTDDPREKNDKFLDVTKRNAKDTQEFRMKLLKRQAPAGLPAQIPARTTLISPQQGWYMPSGITGLYSAAVKARRRRLGIVRAGAFVSYRNQGRI